MKKSITNVGYFPITETDSTINYDAPIYFATAEAGGRSYSADPKGDIQKVYANGQVAYSADNNAGYDVKLTLLDIIDSVEAAWYGKTLVNGTYNGVAEYANADNVLPKFGLVIHEETTDGQGKITFFPYCQINARMSKSGKTSEEGAFDFAFAEHSILASPRPTDRLACFEFQGIDKLDGVPEPAVQGQGAEE